MLKRDVGELPKVYHKANVLYKVVKPHELCSWCGLASLMRVNTDHMSMMCRMEAVLVVPQPDSEPSIVFSACADGHVLRWELDADLNADSYKCVAACL